MNEGQINAVNAGIDTLGTLVDVLGQFGQRRREIVLTDAVAESRRRMNAFQQELRENPDYMSYGQEWARRKEEIAQSISESLRDPIAQEEFYKWYTQEAQSFEQDVVLPMAQQAETATGIATLEKSLEVARELTDYNRRRKQVQFTVNQALTSGYIDRQQAERILSTEYEKLFMDRAMDTLSEIYNEGGYNAAADWIYGENGTNEDQRHELTTALNQMDAFAQRRLMQAREQEDLLMWRHLMAGSLTERMVWDAEYLSRVQREHWIDELRKTAEAQQELGEGTTTDPGRELIAQLITEIDRGERDRVQINNEASQAYREGMISLTERDKLLRREPFESLAGVWTRFDNAMEEIDATATEEARYRRILVEKLRSELYVETENGWAESDNFTQAEQDSLVDNVIREEVVGDKIMQQATKRHYRRGESDVFSRWSKGEQNLRAIDRGQLIGYVGDETYNTIVQAMLNEHKRMFEEVPFTEYVEEAGIDQDGRPIFRARTNLGLQYISWRMIDPDTGEEFSDEMPYYWNGHERRWRPLPTHPIGSAGGGSSAGAGGFNDTAVEGISPP